MSQPSPSIPVVPVPGLSEAIEKNRKAAQPGWERHLKQALAVVVIACGSTIPFLSPTEDAFALKACSIVVAIGAGLGITSRGNPPKR